jgi:hypothetical protein
VAFTVGEGLVLWATTKLVDWLVGSLGRCDDAFDAIGDVGGCG